MAEESSKTKIDPTDETEVSSAMLDSVLASEDPEFAKSMQELKAQASELSAEDQIDTIDINEYVADEAVLANYKGFKRWRKFMARKAVRWVREKVELTKAFFIFLRQSGVASLKENSKLALASLKRGLLVGIIAIRSALGRFAALPGQSKLLLMAALVLGFASFGTMAVVFNGRIFPQLGEQYLRSFAEIADAKYEFNADEPMQDFNDPIFHPEHVVLLERLVVNLRPMEQGANPMGLFEFYIEATAREAAVEIKDREIEVRDAVSRTLEQMSYAELETIDGKNKAKVVLRRSLNGLLTRGRVRRVYFKTVVLKP